VAGNTGVNDTVVNQLLSKIDGVDQLNNILVIGESESFAYSVAKGPTIRLRISKGFK
jgi:hypothetical protein